jgi:hypothetical protein
VNRTRRARILRFAGLVAVAIGVLGLTTAGRVSAQTPPSSDTAAAPSGPYSISARADSVQLLISAAALPAIPNGEVTSASPSSAQATLDSAGSQGFASAPNPGSLVVSLPSTVNGLAAGQAPPAPSYPFAVSSSDPTTPKAGEEIGPYSIQATSDPNRSTADARLGLATASPQVVSATSHADAHLDPTTGLMVAEADTEIAPIRLNQLIALGRISGTANVTYDPANPKAAPKKVSSLSVGTIDIAGVELGLTDKGLTLAGKPLLPVDLSALTEKLGGNGMSIRYAPKTETANSVTSAGVQISYQTTMPDPLGLVTVQLTLGQASATVVPPGELSPFDSGAGLGPAVPSENATGTAPTSGGGDALPSVDDSLPDTGAGSTPSSGGTNPGAPAANQDMQPVRRVAWPLVDTSGFYWILVGAGLVALCSSRLNQWTALRARLGSTLSSNVPPSGPGGSS